MEKLTFIILWVITTYALSKIFITSPLSIILKIKKFLVEKLRVNPYLFTCYFCLSFYTSIIAFIIVKFLTPIAYIFAVAGIVSIIVKLLGEDNL